MSFGQVNFGLEDLDGTNSAVRLSSAADLDVDLGKFTNFGSSIEMESTAGRLRVGSFNGGTFTPDGSLNSTGVITLRGKTGVDVGMMLARRDITLEALEGRVSFDSAFAAVSESQNQDAVPSNIQITGRDGVTGVAAWSLDGNVNIAAPQGAVTISSVEASSWDSARKPAVQITAQGNVSVIDGDLDAEVLADGNIDITSSQGRVLIEGDTVSTTGRVQLTAQTGVTAQVVKAGSFVDAQAKAGAVQVGNIVGAGAKTAPSSGPADACAGNAVCVQAGTGATASSSTTYSVSTGSITASGGGVLVGGPNGVLVNGELRTSDASIALNSSQSGVKTSAVNLLDATSASQRKLQVQARGKVEMGAISVGPAAVDLSSAEDELVLDQITLGGALSLRSRANLTVNPSKLSGGSSYSISSTGGELRIGSVTAGTFTAGDLSVSGGGVTLAGQTALRAGNVTARDAIDM
ncbi:MAG: hypothetical protein EBZ91_13855, partial [Gammaproteobacteria bacterium]|nr:hypothetical protein [Gammaproteobacteria bacterium]